MVTRSFTHLIAGLAAASLFFGCSSDLDVRAPYKEITVVYSLLNRNDDTVWFKINKAFLGEGNAYEYAQIADSNEYTDAQFQGVVEELAEDGSVVTTHALQSMNVDRPVGIFYAPAHKMYYFLGDDTPADGRLNEDHTYRLKATCKGNSIEASTSLVHDFSIHNVTAGVNQQGRIGFVLGGNYVAYDIKWSTGENGKRYDVYYRFHYDEVTSEGTTPKSFTSLAGTRIVSGGSGAQTSVALNGEVFYQTVAANVPPAAPNNVEKRIFRGIDLIWEVAGPDLYTFLQLTHPISGLVEERPDFTNIANGYGLMSTRIFKMVGSDDGDQTVRKNLNPASETELMEGSYTADRLFCIGGSIECP